MSYPETIEEWSSHEWKCEDCVNYQECDDEELDEKGLDRDGNGPYKCMLKTCKKNLKNAETVFLNSNDESFCNEECCYKFHDEGPQESYEDRYITEQKRKNPNYQDYREQCSCEDYPCCGHTDKTYGL